MTPERWRQVEDICHAALARPPEERAAFLTQTCAGDNILQHEVESLLAQEPNTARFMSVPAAAVAPSVVLDQAKGTLVGQRFGVYAIRSPGETPTEASRLAPGQSVGLCPDRTSARAWRMGGV